MYHPHEDIIEKIFIHLNNDDKLQVLRSVVWFRSMKSLTKRLCLYIHKNNYQGTLKDVSGIWVRRINMDLFGSSVLYQPINCTPQFRDSLEHVTLSDWRLPSGVHLIRAIEPLKRLSELCLILCRLEPGGNRVNLKQMHIKVLKLAACSIEVMAIFAGQEVEHLEFQPLVTPFCNNAMDIIGRLMQSARSVHFNGGYKDCDTHCPNLRKLKISNEFPSLVLFMKANCDNLRELEIDYLPFNLNGGNEEANFILKKMNLNKFTCKKSALIDNGKLDVHLLSKLGY